MIIWYKNSILASIISIFGCLAATGGISQLAADASQRAMSVPEAVGAIAGGVLLVILGKFLSLHKAEKKARAQQASSAPAAPQQTYAAPSAPQQTYAAPAQTRSAASVRPLKKAPAFAAAFFLIAAAAGAGYAALQNVWLPHMNAFTPDYIAQLAALLLLFIASLRTHKAQAVCLLYALGFAVLAAVFGLKGMNLYRVYGFGGYSDANGVYNALALSPLLQAAAYALCALFALCSTGRKSLGPLVRALWFVPLLLLLLCAVKDISDSHIPQLFSLLFTKGMTLRIRPEYFELLSCVAAILGSAAALLTMRRACKAPAEPVYSAPAEPVYAAPAEPVYAAPAEPVYSAPAEPVYSAPAEPVYSAPAQAADDQIQKQIKACRDLLDCGILTQAEYDQKIREITQG